MAGGLLIVLNLDGTMKAREIGSGIHGGEIIIRGDVDDACLAAGAKKVPLTDEDREKDRPGDQRVFQVTSGSIQNR